jgi:Na+/H+ antiporter NhaD/arsenite permease-like protein
VGRRFFAEAMNAALQLLITLTGVTLLFGCAQANGTMEGAAKQALRLCRGNAALLPWAFFFLAAILASVGPGAILSTALVMPFAMGAAARAGIPIFLTALMVGNGANAGNLSPFSTVGVIVNGLMTRVALGGHEYRIWAFHAAAHVTVAAAAFLLFGGLRSCTSGAWHHVEAPPVMERRHALTLGVIAAWITGVVAFAWPLGWTAAGAASILLLARAANWREAVRHIPWRVILMVVTISSIVGLLDRLGVLGRFQDLVARYSDARSVHAVMAFLTGAISAYSSTSGVVLPAFLPMVPGIAARLPGVDAFSLAVSVCIGSALVDVSPLSTLGALAIANAPDEADKAKLFRALLLWGLSMSVAGAMLCHVGAPFFTP